MEGIVKTTNLRAVLLVTCLALMSVVSAMSSLNVALPSIAKATHASQTSLEWIVDAYSLVFAALLLPAGALGDRYGRRRMLLVGLAVFAAGSLGATLVTSSGALIALRAVLGVGAAFVMPATLSTITSTFPAQARGRAISIWAGVAGAGALVGLLTSGALLEAFSWRSVFGLNVVLATVALVGTLRFVPESSEHEGHGLDVRGALIAVVGLAAVVYALIEAPDAGWGSVRTIGELGFGLLVLAAFVVFEARQPHPTLDPRVFRNRAFAAGTLTVFLQFFSMFGFFFGALQYLQLVRGDSALVSAVSVLPLGAAMMPSSRVAPVLAARVGRRRVILGGLILIGAGMVVLSRLQVDSSYGLILAGLVPLGMGMGLAMTPATTAITEALPDSQQGVGSAMNDLARELGGALGIAVLGSVLTAAYRSHLHLGDLPPALADKARSSLGVAARVGGDVARQSHHAFVDGMHASLICGAVVAWLAALAVAVLLRHEARAPRSAHAVPQELRDDHAPRVDHQVTHLVDAEPIHVGLHPVEPQV
jgi:EmrB/QacA subfamily drug resistance transporter